MAGAAVEVKVTRDPEQATGCPRGWGYLQKAGDGPGGLWMGFKNYSPNFSKKLPLP